MLLLVNITWQDIGKIVGHVPSSQSQRSSFTWQSLKYPFTLINEIHQTLKLSYRSRIKADSEDNCADNHYTSHKKKKDLCKMNYVIY